MTLYESIENGSTVCDLMRCAKKQVRAILNICYEFELVTFVLHANKLIMCQCVLLLKNLI